MEPHQECAYDHIVVYDGHTTDARVLGRFCGSKLPYSAAASDNKMLLVFKSDASVQRRGFLAKHVTGKKLYLSIMYFDWAITLRMCWFLYILEHFLFRTREGQNFFIF